MRANLNRLSHDGNGRSSLSVQRQAVSSTHFTPMTSTSETVRENEAARSCSSQLQEEDKEAVSKKSD
ncbi:hypothetical protein O9929_18950 [Vibrio lentus]|nr:hypothetical protein [Vibrio lentus]